MTNWHPDSQTGSFLYTLGPPRDGNSNCGQGHPMSIANQENAWRTCPNANMREEILQLEVSLPRYVMLTSKYDRGQPQELFLRFLLHWGLKQSLLLAWNFNKQAGLVGQQAPGICLSLPTILSGLGYKCALLCSPC